MCNIINGIPEGQFVYAPQDVIGKQFLLDHDNILVNGDARMLDAWSSVSDSWKIIKQGKEFSRGCHTLKNGDYVMFLTWK